MSVDLYANGIIEVEVEVEVEVKGCDFFDVICNLFIKINNDENAYIIDI